MVASEYQLLDYDAFNRLVAEKDLATWTQRGYIHCKVRGKNGIEMYRTFIGDWIGVPISTGVTADPAAGANPAVVTVPVGKRWLLTAVYVASMVTSVDVASRVGSLVITDGTNTQGAFMFNGNQAASLTRQYNWAMGIGAGYLANTVINITLPTVGVELKAGWTFQVTFVNIQAADDCGVVRYTYKEVDA